VVIDGTKFYIVGGDMRRDIDQMIRLGDPVFLG